MKTLLFIVPLFVFPFIAFSQKEQANATMETMSNTINLHGDKLIGTCFMVTEDEKQYFVTVAHLFNPSHKSGDLVPVKMVIENQLQSFDANVYFHANRKIDLAVFTLSKKVSQNLKLPEELMKNKEFFQKLLPGKGISRDSIFSPPATDVFFFGFPLEGLGNEIFGLKLPLVKKAIISGWVKNRNVDLLLLDGHVNVGFSGGPVVSYNTSTKKMCLVGVVSAYLPESIDVKQKKETLSVNANSGIIVCYDRRYIEEIFTNNKKDLR